MMKFIWLIPLFPLAGFLLNGLLGRRGLPKRFVHTVACGAMLLSFLLSLAAVVNYVSLTHGQVPFEVELYQWIPAGAMHTWSGHLAEISIALGFQLDPLSAVMILVVTGIGFLIHVYSIGYMAHEEGYYRFFAYLNLFVFFMLLLVLGNNFVVMFVGWEGVGLCSYLLIGFYFDKNVAADAGKKAFVTNRIGDFGFILAIFLIFWLFGSADFTEVFARAAAGGGELAAGRTFFPLGAGIPWTLTMSFATAIAVFLFVGACGKSAQIPLYVWLPDAMAGPTPVSALIHAATMVTAGVYMVARCNVFYRLSPTAMVMVAAVGAATAFFAATIGLAQTDIKKVLAYSTVSQLGYMFMAEGVGGFGAGIFHLMTHAFFKALLFLGAGSVIHAMSGEQDMRQMGGLKKHIPVTFATVFIGWYAICGLPPFAGFFSKDEILAAAFARGHATHQAVFYVVWGVGLLTAGITAFYMTRFLRMTFYGSFRGTHDQEHHLHESPKSMTVPLVILAAGSIGAGWIGIPQGMTFGKLDINLWHHWMQPIFIPIAGFAEPAAHLSLGLEWALILASVAVAGLGIAWGWVWYGDPALARPRALAAALPNLHALIANKYYVDEFYDRFVVGGTKRLADLLWKFDAEVIDGAVNGTRNVTVVTSYVAGFFDKYVIDGAVNLMATLWKVGSFGLRRLQTGLVSNYALMMAYGVFALVLLMILFQ